VRRQPGFRWRRISQHADGTFIDIVAWDTMANAEASARCIMTEVSHSAVHTMIDQRTVDWRLAPVLQQIAREA
jgi:hypothetical protein